ncbi:MAG: NADH-quinone oxidoreductase subunit N [Planctomycetes bacterium]|nr:NADH-quinone oxidoreductase subunit N [Planctomycetota bacterium]MBU4398107.1 NADH-quinone oxidoreductase subunit N [Planctomycetota bacterium]MCG2684304.1 NADH-quinone oxidoreductase subunit N [Planctomycetales bacterium]
MTAADLRLLVPEIVLIAAAVTIYLGGAFSTARRAWSWIAGGALLLAAAALWMQNPSTPEILGATAGLSSSAGNTAGQASSGTLHFQDGGSLGCDALARYVQWLALAAGALLVSLASRPLRFDGTPEYVGSLLLTVAGLMLVAAAEDIVLLFVALELISIPTYVLLYLGRGDAESQESAAKYFFLGVLASAILLYGFSFLYGATGSTALSEVRAALDGTETLPPGFAVFARLAMALVFAGLCFKVAAVPFHFYAPDVYQGTTHANAALLSVVPKAAGFVAMARILVAAMPGMEPYCWAVVLAVAVLTMTFGNVMALWQDDFRRLLAYSSIAQTGYMLLALAVGLAARDAPGAWNGIVALWFYLATYAAATIGAFATMEYLGRPERRLDSVDDLAGLGRTRPAAAAVMAVCMFSLTGVPPLAGFWGKLLVFGGALNVDTSGTAGWWFTAAAIVGVLNAAVAAAYYLRIVAVMYFRIPLATPSARGGRGAWTSAVVCALLVVGIGIYPGPLMRAGNFGAEPLTRAGHFSAQCVRSGGTGVSPVLDEARARCPCHPTKKKPPPPQPAPQLGMAATKKVPAPNAYHLRRALVLSRIRVTTSCHIILK